MNKEDQKNFEALADELRSQVHTPQHCNYAKQGIPISNKKWIALKDQQPGDDQFPVALGVWWNGEWTEVTDCSVMQPGWTHWYSDKLPTPPPREKTLAEMDAQAFLWWKEKTPWASEQCAFMAALAYERAEIAKICTSEVGRDSELLERVFARVKGGAK